MRSPEEATVAAFAEHWITTSSAPPYVTPYTTKIRRQFLDLYVIPRLGERLIAELGTRELVDLQRSLFERKLATSTVRHVFGNLVSPMLKQARREGVIGEVPDLDMVWPKRPPHAPDSFTVAERDAILDDFAERRPGQRALCSLVFLAGLRPSEAAALAWGSFDERTGAVSISRSFVDGTFGPTKTRAATRKIVVGERLRGILADCRPSEARRDSLVAAGDDGQPIDPRRWSARAFQNSLRRLRIPIRGLYCGRHTFISIAISAQNANIAKVAAYCGTSVAMIERHYLQHLVALTDPTAGAAGVQTLGEP